MIKPIDPANADQHPKRLPMGLDYQGRYEEAAAMGEDLAISEGILTGLLLTLAMFCVIGLLAFWVWG